ncbi:MAG: winged helix-turn-helix domain-containing protein, partial [Candidatus Angelobacter sp.]
MLCALAERPGEVVTREELRAKLWPADTFVEFDDSLNHAVRKLRQVLEDSAENPQLIETLPRHGYRFMATVETAIAPERALSPRRRTVKTAILSGVALLAVVAALYAFDAGGWRSRLFGHASSPPIRSLAVLPLSNLSGDAQQDYFADGMTDALITDLAKIREIKVISRTSVMQFKDVKKPLPEIARALGVDGILEGSAQRSGEHVRITVQLIRASAEAHYTMAAAAYYYRWDWDEADREFRRALSLDPSLVEARFEYAWFL